MVNKSMAYLFLVAIFLIINTLCVISLIFIERKEPTTTWAWLLILLILPGIGFLAYLVLGQNLSRQKLFREKIVRDVKRAKELEEKYKKLDKSTGTLEDYKDLIKMNYNHCGALYTNGNAVKIFTKGEDKFRELFKDIRNAKKFIHVEYYILRMDELGKAFIEELGRKVEEGVEVRLVIDGMGSKGLRKKDMRYIESLGIKFAIFFRGTLPHINTRINYRNHRKIVVIDGTVGYVGGFNIGNEYLTGGKDFKFWRDTHVKIQGEAVNELNKRFIQDWDYAAEGDIDDYKEYFPKSKDYGRIGIQIVSSGPDHNEEYIKNAYMKIINNAKKNVYIQTPYLVPDESMLEALKISALSGVDVRILVPDKPDHFFMEWILSANVEALIKFGVKMYRYKKGFIHSKTIVADGEVCSIGTANLDIRSFRLNFEINAIIYDEEVALGQEEVFFRDIDDSVLIDPEKFAKRSRSLKIKESLIRLLAPIL